MLIIVGGPMFAGKTTWLINYLRTLPVGSYQLFKPNIDTRYSISECVSHDGLSSPAKNLDIQTPLFPELKKETKTVIIDELNFFDPKTLLPQIKKLLAAGLTVVGAGLLLDFKQEPFGATMPLMKLADEKHFLVARCDRCGKKASLSYRKTASQDQIVLGAKDKYGACCEQCYSQLSQNS